MQLPVPYFSSVHKSKTVKNYQYETDESSIRAAMEAGEWGGAFEVLAEPIHRALYEAQDFSILQDMSVEERLILSFDYIQMQALSGGFIQLIQNNYVSLLVPAIEGLQQTGLEAGMISLLDDVLRVYVLNRDALDKETSVEEFGKLYEEFKEFESLDQRFTELQPETIKAIVRYVVEETIQTNIATPKTNNP